ncbi:MAG: hypothetical protein JSU73_09205 [candidate division WOR-3 bacterium]|nr:MAG: hypothetical protein JSU73_09205 [candidate division WOR-3 bacterium]
MVSILIPVNGDTLAKRDIVIKTLATDNKAVTRVEFFVDRSLVRTDNLGGAADTFRHTWSDTAAQTAAAPDRPTTRMRSSRTRLGGRPAARTSCRATSTPARTSR